MRFVPTRIEGVTIIELDFKGDERGGFVRTFCGQEFADAGIDFSVAQANLSTNAKARTLRGLHFQKTPHGEPKVVSCVRGRIFDVAVDVRPESATYRQWEGVELGGDFGRMMFLDRGIAHGFLTLEADSWVHYLMGASYIMGLSHGLRWNDPAIGIDWPAVPEVISDRDRTYPLIDR